MLGIYNDDVTKRVFIYSINLTVSGGDTNARIRGELEFFNNDVPKSGTNITPINGKLQTLLIIFIAKKIINI